MASEHSTKGDALHNAEPLSWERESGKDDPAQRFRLYRLCDCAACSGTGKILSGPSGTWRCPDCRGEGRTLELVATCATAEAVGVALVTLGREGEWSDCPVGVLDSQGEKGEKWIVRPWERSAREVSAAGRTLARSKGIVAPYYPDAHTDLENAVRDAEKS